MKKTAALLFCCIIIVSACAPKTVSDGEYTVKAEISGGSGRAAIVSPAKITVKGENITAIIEWSSPFYEYMEVESVRYLPIQKEGNSTFEIPVKLDEDIDVSACTIAMSEPHIVEYVLRLDGSSIERL